MFSFSHLLIGLLVTASGVVMLKYNFKLVGITGRQAWIEDHLGSGTTYFVYQVMAIIVTIGGLLYATGLGNSVISILESPLKGIFSGVN